MISEISKKKEKQVKLEKKFYTDKPWSVSEWIALQTRILEIFNDISENEKAYVDLMKEKILRAETEEAKEKLLENLLKDKFFIDQKVSLIKVNMDLLTKYQNGDNQEDSKIDIKKLMKSFKF